MGLKLNTDSSQEPSSPFESLERKVTLTFDLASRTIISHALSEREFHQSDIWQPLLGLASPQWRDSFTESYLSPLATHPNSFSENLQAGYEIPEPENFDLRSAGVPESYLGKLERAIIEKGLDFSTLNQLHRRCLSQTAIPELLNEVIDACRGQERFPARAAFDIVSARIGDSSLGLPLRYAGDLYFLTFLPRALRWATQDLIIGETMIKYTDSLKGEHTSPEATRTLDLLDQYWRAYGLTASQPYNLVALDPDQRPHQLISKARLEQFGRIKELGQLIKNESAYAALNAHTEKRSDLYDFVVATSSGSSCRNWQDMDVGHVFKGFQPFDLASVRLDEIGTRMGMKDGSLAVILEDTIDQQAPWMKLVQEFSHSDLLPGRESVCTHPNQLDRHIKDSRIKLFLLDIQGAEDPEAGIKAAEGVLRERCTWGGTRQHTKIIVWSYSEEAVVSAEKQLQVLVEKTLDRKREIVSGFSVSGGNRPVEISFLQKSSPSLYSNLAYG